jgi:DNA repair ATPase RecN
LQTTVVLADEDVRRVIRTISADVQAALALSRATLQAVASMSPALNAAAEEALDQELELAARQAAPQRAVETIEAARARLQDMPEQVEMLSALERALLAAADALPDIQDLDAAEAAVRAQ